MEHTSDSQIPSVSRTLSLPSEPPDIRNWFPSYKYESFVWDTYDDFGGSIFKETEYEGDGFALAGERNGAEEGNWDESKRNGNSDDKMPDSLYSSSIPSEPPHIRNWFPSYETPASDIVDDSLKCVAKESEREDGFGIEGSQNGTENFQEFRNSRESKEGGAVLSESPDITGQFHSCVYESPVLGESDEFSHKEAEGQEFDFVNQNSRKEQEINPKKFGQIKSLGEVVVDEKLHMNEFLKFNSSLGDDKQENQPLDKMPDSLYSSIPSEPPHIRNWFPSYETPAFDSGDDFLKSVAKESESEYGFAIEGSNEEREENFLQSSNSGNKNEVGAGEKLCSNGFFRLKSSFGDVYEKKSLSKIPESSQSSSVASEPTEIRNGFHMGVNESPLLGESDEFEHKEIEGKKSDSVYQTRNKERGINLNKFEEIESSDEVVVDEKVHMNGFFKFNSYLGDDKQESQTLDKGNSVVRKENSATGDILLRNTEQLLEGGTFPFPNQGLSLTKYAKKSNFLNDEGLLCKQQAKQNCPTEAALLMLKSNMTSSNNDRKSGTGLIHGKDFTENLEAKTQIEVGVFSSVSNAGLIRDIGASTEKPAGGRNDKENGGNETSGNGFVMPRKGRITRSKDENSLNRPDEILLECSRNKGRASSVEEKDGIVKGKVLSERTNFENSAANETTGKWQCPRKCKPSVGPPLKQLRLERWVQRL